MDVALWGRRNMRAARRSAHRCLASSSRASCCPGSMRQGREGGGCAFCRTQKGAAPTSLRSRSTCAPVVVSFQRTPHWSLVHQAEPAAMVVGTPCPPISGLTFVKGEPIAPGSPGQGVVVLELWAPWCGPCIQSIPVGCWGCAAWRRRARPCAAVPATSCPARTH